MKHAEIFKLTQFFISGCSQTVWCRISYSHPQPENHHVKTGTCSTWVKQGPDKYTREFFVDRTFEIGVSKIKPFDTRARHLDTFWDPRTIGNRVLVNLLPTACLFFWFTHKQCNRGAFPKLLVWSNSNALTLFPSLTTLTRLVRSPFYTFYYVWDIIKRPTLKAECHCRPASNVTFKCMTYEIKFSNMKGYNLSR